MEHRASSRYDYEEVSNPTIVSLDALSSSPKSSVCNRSITYRNNLSREIRRVRILLTIIRIIQDIPERSLRYRCSASEHRNNSGKSERRTHDTGNNTLVNKQWVERYAQTMQQQREAL
jgi:hypothetical protein